MKVKFTRADFNELAQIHSHIARDNPEAALGVFVRIKEVIQRLGEFPYLARIADESGIRVFPAMPFPYLIFYTVGHREVIIRNIRHAGRNRP